MFFKLDKLVENYELHIISDNIEFEIFSVFWKYLGQFFLKKKVKQRVGKVF
jgi:hypothetical protein